MLNTPYEYKPYDSNQPSHCSVVCVCCISVNDVLLRLSEYQLLPQFLTESIIDRAIAPITCTSEETAAAVDQFFGDRHLATEADRQVWLEQAGIILEHAQAIATRPAE